MPAIVAYGANDWLRGWGCIVRLCFLAVTPFANAFVACGYVCCFWLAGSVFANRTPAHALLCC